MSGNLRSAGWEAQAGRLQTIFLNLKQGCFVALSLASGSSRSYHSEADLTKGKEALRQAIIKRLLPEWSLSTLNPVSYPLLLRDPFTIVVETAAVAPEMLRHVLVLSYYALLARTVIGLIYV
jgi:hypothetical protein